MSKKPTMLLIMDGFGANPSGYGNAIKQASTPNLDAIFANYPGTEIDACGEAVGLPQGQMGNSEVGHMNLGAGRIIYQNLSRISNAIKDESFYSNSALLDAMEHVKKNNSTLHFMGLCSDGGVHSSIDHLIALIEMAKRCGVDNLIIHNFLDGRDVPPRCAKIYLSKIRDIIRESGIGAMGIISGRYYAMDRDKRWDRVQNAYDAMTLGKGFTADCALDAIDMAYDRDESDEFVQPTIVQCADMKDVRRTVDDGDSIIFYNFRPDRAREITRAFVDKDFDGFVREKVVNDLTFVCMTEYDASMPNVEIAYPPEHYDNTLGEYISKMGLRQLRIAETEKYAHVTFFFNGGVEEPNKDEDRILIPSPKVATYDLQPEMSAPLITDRVLEEISQDKYDLIILNFANADMVGHTGIMDAAIKAIETLDTCIPRIKDAVLSKGGEILLTADHGNADVMLDENGKIVTSHSLNKVPLYYISNEPKALKDGGKLADIAPTLLTMMGLPIPKEMKGNVLI